MGRFWFDVACRFVFVFVFEGGWKKKKEGAEREMFDVRKRACDSDHDGHRAAGPAHATDSEPFVNEDA